METGEDGLGHGQIERPGDLESAIVAGHACLRVPPSLRPCPRRRCGRRRRWRARRPASSRRKPCGVCTARSTDRSTVATTSPRRPTRLIVSATGSTGIDRRRRRRRSAAATDSISDGGVSARAASCTRTRSNSARYGRKRARHRLLPGGATRHHADRSTDRASSARTASTSRPEQRPRSARSTARRRHRERRAPGVARRPARAAPSGRPGPAGRPCPQPERGSRRHRAHRAARSRRDPR